MNSEERSDGERPDLLALFDDLAPWFESLRGMVAAHVAEGFTDDQAHELVTYMITHSGSSS